MWRVAYRRRLVVVAIGMLAGCFEITPEQKARDVCTALCDCLVPANADRCITEQCLPRLPPVSDPCLNCVYANSQRCGDLVDQCLALCGDDNDPTPLLGGDR
jgi:hypothetical protein